MNDSSIPNSSKACSAALGFFPPGGSWLTVGKHLEAATVGGSQAELEMFWRPFFMVFSGVLKETLCSLRLWELEKHNGVLLDLWS